ILPPPRRRIGAFIWVSPQFRSPPLRAEREGPIAQQWEGEVGIGERSGIPHLTLPSPPPGAEREWRRRDLIASLAATAAARPRAGQAQQTGPRRVGVLIGFPENDPFTQGIVSAFTRALAGFGWVE